MEQKTPLYDCHAACGGRLVPFAGYLMPMQYTGIIEEHMAVRNRAGLFDVSHMGEVLIVGPDAQANVNNLYANDFTRMPVGRVCYTVMCNERGGIVDDMMVYRMAEDRFMAVPNASNRHKVVAHMRAHLKGDVMMEDISDSIAQIALQGPKSRDILARVTDEGGIPAKYYTFIDDVKIAAIKCLVSRTGYTGEAGYEMYCESADAAKLWSILLEAGKDDGLAPCGLGARDTLRLEAAMPLYGHEMTDDISPLETGLAFSVKLQKEDFIGKQALVNKGEPQIARVGLKITGRGIAREHNPVYIGRRSVGEVTSGTFLPYLEGAYAMALIHKEYAEIGTVVEIEVRGRKITAEIVSLPFYSRLQNYY